MMSQSGDLHSINTNNTLLNLFTAEHKPTVEIRLSHSTRLSSAHSQKKMLQVSMKYPVTVFMSTSR